MSYKYTYKEWSQDTRTFEIESKVKLTEEEIVDIATTTPENEVSVYQTKDFTSRYTGTEWGDDCQFEITGDTKNDKKN